MKAAIFIIAIITNQGELQMKAEYLQDCPDKQVVTETLDKLKSEGQFIDWNALCLHPQTDAKVEGND